MTTPWLIISDYIHLIKALSCLVALQWVVIKTINLFILWSHILHFFNFDHYMFALVLNHDSENYQLVHMENCECIVVHDLPENSCPVSSKTIYTDAWIPQKDTHGYYTYFGRRLVSYNVQYELFSLSNTENLDCRASWTPCATRRKGKKYQHFKNRRFFKISFVGFSEIVTPPSCELWKLQLTSVYGKAWGV